MTVPSAETTARVKAQFRDVIELARQVSVAESDWDLYKIAAVLLRDGGDVAPVYQQLSISAGVVRWIAGRCGDTPGIIGSPAMPVIHEQTIAAVVDSVNWALMTHAISHREAAIQKQIAALADPRIPTELIAPLAEQFVDAAMGRIDRLEAVEAGVHLIAHLASVSGNAITTLDAVEHELLGPPEAVPDPTQQEGDYE